jgi:hypothetical protein
MYIAGQARTAAATHLGIGKIVNVQADLQANATCT